MSISTVSYKIGRKIIIIRFFFCFVSICVAFSSFGQNKVTVKIHSMTEGYRGFENFADSAAKRLECVLNSKKFEEAITRANFTKTNGLSNDEIFATIMRAHEEQGEGGTDGVVDLRVRTVNAEIDKASLVNRYCNGNTIGIDGLGDGVMAICPQKLAEYAKSNNLAALAAHYAHEYMHILNFGHPGLFKSRSVVYKVGEIIEELVKECK